MTVALPGSNLFPGPSLASETNAGGRSGDAPIGWRGDWLEPSLHALNLEAGNRDLNLGYPLSGTGARSRLAARL